MTSTPAPPSGRSWRFARATAPLTRSLAGRRFFPLWAVVHHRGRTSGREMSLPVAVRATPEAFVIALPWGPGTNWVRNVQAAGGCTLRWRGRDVAVTRPELLDPQAARPHYPAAMWAFVQRVFAPSAFLLLHRADAPTAP